jgi:hypothetical protein
VCGLHAAAAQDASAPGGYQFFVTHPPTVSPSRRRC